MPSGWNNKKPGFPGFSFGSTALFGLPAGNADCAFRLIFRSGSGCPVTLATLFVAPDLATLFTTLAGVLFRFENDVHDVCLSVNLTS